MTDQYGDVLAQLNADVETGIEEAYVQEGYADDEGTPSDPKMREAAFQALLKEGVVGSKAERSKKALTNGELYSLVFPHGPAAGERNPQLDEVSERVLKKLLSTVWGLTQTKRNGFLQRRFETEGVTLILCRCQVFRHAEGAQAVYATDNEALIMEDAVDKEIQSLVRRATALRRDLGMIIERHPKLQGAIATRLEIELGRIDSELALEAGAPGRKQLAASK